MDTQFSLIRSSVDTDGRKANECLKAFQSSVDQLKEILWSHRTLVSTINFNKKPTIEQLQMATNSSKDIQNTSIYQTPTLRDLPSTSIKITNDEPTMNEEQLKMNDSKRKKINYISAEEYFFGLKDQY